MPKARFHLLCLLSVWVSCAQALNPEKVREAFIKAVESATIGIVNPPTPDQLGVEFLHTVFSKLTKTLTPLEENPPFHLIGDSTRDALVDIFGEVYLNKYANKSINAYYFTRTFSSTQYTKENQEEFHPTALVYSLEHDQFVIEYLLESRMGEKNYSRPEAKSYVSHLLRRGLRFEERYYPPEKISLRMQDAVRMMPLLFDVSSNVIQGLFERKTILVGNQEPPGDFLGTFIGYPLRRDRTRLLADLFYTFLQNSLAISTEFDRLMITTQPTCARLIAF